MPSSAADNPLFLPPFLDIPRRVRAPSRRERPFFVHNAYCVLNLLTVVHFTDSLTYPPTALLLSLHGLGTGHHYFTTDIDDATPPRYKAGRHRRTAMVLRTACRATVLRRIGPRAYGVRIECPQRKPSMNASPRPGLLLVHLEVSLTRYRSAPLWFSQSPLRCSLSCQSFLSRLHSRQWQFTHWRH